MITKKHITNSISSCFGKLANTKFPKPLQHIINQAYVSIMNVDLSEFNGAGSYESLNMLFTRKLIKERQFDSNPDYFISPTDSLVTELGQVSQGSLLQIKGMEYSVEDLLTERAGFIDKMLNGSYINFYLSPKDYHRYHSPNSLKVNKLIHVPGKLYPVNNTYLNRKENLFVENERVILECEFKDGHVFYIVFVGALNVGQMVIKFEPKVATNSNTHSVKVYEYENQLIKKGECLGYFKMGSTVVIVFQKDFVELQTRVSQKIRFGDIIAKIIGK